MSTSTSSSTNGIESQKLANELLEMESTLQKLRTEMSKVREKRKELPKGAIWNQANKIRQQAQSTTIHTLGSLPTRTLSGTSRGLSSTSTRAMSGSSSKNLSGTSSSRTLPKAALVSTSSRSTSSRTTLGTRKVSGNHLGKGTKVQKITNTARPSLSETADLKLDDLITVRATGIENLPSHVPLHYQRGVKEYSKHYNENSTSDSKKSATSMRVKTINRQQLVVPHQSTDSSTSTLIGAVPIQNIKEEAVNFNTVHDKNVHDESEDALLLRNEAKFLILPEERSTYTYEHNELANTNKMPQQANSSTLSTSLYQGDFNVVTGVAEDSTALDYTNDEFEVLESPNIDKLPADLSVLENTSKSLLDGSYDENANAKDFREAVLEWRKSNGVTTSTYSSCSQSTGTSTQFYTQEAGSLLDGEYNEHENQIAFQKAVAEYRQSLLPSNSHATSTVENRSREISIREIRKPKISIPSTLESKSSNNATQSIGDETSKISDYNPVTNQSGSLLEGTYDEEANQRAFQEAVMRWRRQNLTQNTMEASRVKSETSAGNNVPLPRHPKLITSHFANNLRSCLYPTYFDKVVLSIDSTFLF